MTMPTTLIRLLNGFILFCFVSAAALALYLYSYSSSSDSKEVCAGCFMPIKNVDDPNLRLLAEFAISEYNNKMQSHQPPNHLVFQNLVRAKSQVVQGTCFELVITAVNQSTSSSPPRHYEAVVCVDLSQTHKKLVSFKLA